ncbi:MAG: HD domain-containing protein [Patescibacteria group bacterium]|nr:HD domain-containing protein [Patescibacteria group bacterium]
MNVLKEAREYFLQLGEKSQGEKYFTLDRHAEKVEKWVLKISEDYYQQADREVLVLSAWLHDVGFYIGNSDDHAINSEVAVKIFLKGKISQEKLEKVSHCVRAHRCKDIMPSSIEAKILAFSDSASHMVDFIYLDMFRMFGLEAANSKLERDWEMLIDYLKGRNCRNFISIGKSC